MSEEERKKLDQDKRKFWQDLVAVFQKGFKPDHKDVQKVVSFYITFFKRPGLTFTKEQRLQSVAGIRQMPEHMKRAVEKWPEFKDSYAEQMAMFDENPGLADYLADAAKSFFERN